MVPFLFALFYAEKEVEARLLFRHKKLKDINLSDHAFRSAILIRMSTNRAH